MEKEKKNKTVQCTLEQHGYELHGSTYVDFFPINNLKKLAEEQHSLK